MPWCNANVRNSLCRLAFAAGLLLCAINLNAVPVGAVDTSTDIGVSICGGNVPPAQVAITQPVNDSVVNQPNVNIRGTVAHTSQIEISIDGQYSSTVSIGPSDSTFQTTLTLPTGTHTVKATANAVCGGQSASSNVVVTYTPIVDEPSSGETTPTKVGDETIIGSEDTQASDSVFDPEVLKQINQIPVIGSAISAVSDFAAAIGLESTVMAGNAGGNVAVGTARVGLTVVALTSVVMASTVAPMVATSVPGISELFNVSSQRSMLYLGWIIRGVGALTMAIVYFV